MSFDKCTKWKKSITDRGVLTGCDQNQEWLLVHWWKNYTKHNQFPIAFIDFGMSKSAKMWCEKHGVVVTPDVPNDMITAKEEISPITTKFWERIYPGNFWPGRKAWFAKPFALLQTPFKHSLWIDLDCEVRGDLAEPFSVLNQGHEFAIVPTTSTYERSCHITGLHRSDERVYNAGFLAYSHTCPLIQKWAENVYSRNHEFLGDENALIRTISEEKWKVKELPSDYNTPCFLPEPDGVKVVHYCGHLGKQKLLQRI